MTPRLIALDMDGTLLNSEGRVSSRNREALRLAENAGVEVVIATGRRHSYAMRVLRELNLQDASTLISSNGTVLRRIGDAELVHRTHMSLDTARWLVEHIREYRSTLVLTFDNVGADGDDARGALVCEAYDTLHASIGRWMDANEAYFAPVERLEDALVHTPPIQMMICGTVEQMARAEARLREHPRIVGVGEDETPDAEITLHRTIYPDRDLSIVDILPAGCSKASALLRLLGDRGLEPADLLAIGDNWNDAPMLDLAGCPVLMGNAPDDLIQRAMQRGWALAPTNDQDGVAVSIEAALTGQLTAAGV